MRSFSRNRLFLSASGLIFALVLFLSFPRIISEAAALPVGDYGPDTYAETYCVIDGNTNEVILCRGMHERRYPASTTKVMTALLTLENVSDLNATLTFTQSAVNIDPSSSTLSPKAQAGETMRVIDVLYGMLLVSGNECGAMLGEYVAGSEAAFAEMMNRKAAELGCTNTHFTNAYGIHNDDHYTTAYDLCLILQAAMNNAKFCEIMRNVTYTIPATNLNSARGLRNSHQLLNGDIACEGVIGGKTGSTPQAGRTLVTAVKRNGLYTISALMKSNKENYYCDEQVLLEYAYGLRDGSIPSAEVAVCDDTVTANENVKIRYSPSMYGAEAGALYTGESIRRTGTIRGWSRVIYGERLCYVSSAYVTPSSGAEAETSETGTTEPPTTTTEPTTTEPTTTTAPPTTTAPATTAAPTTTAAPVTSSEALSTAASSEPPVSVKTRKTFGEVFSAMIDSFLTVIPILIIVVFAAVWVLLLVRLVQKKRRERLRREKLRRRTEGEEEE